MKGLVKRRDICKAIMENPDLTYVELQVRFKTSSRVVADALKGGLKKWEELLQGGNIINKGLAAKIRDDEIDAPSMRLNRVSGYKFIVAEPVLERGLITGYTYQEINDGDTIMPIVPVDVMTMPGLVAHLQATLGWELVTLHRIPGSEFKYNHPFQGEYECVFKFRSPNEFVLD